MSFAFDKFANDHRIVYSEKRGWKQFSCPFCRGSGDYLGYSEETEAFYCWKCGKHSKKETALKLSNLDWKDILNRYFIDTRPKERMSKEIKRAKEFIIPKFFTELSAIHIKYLRKRGYDAETIVREWSVAGSPKIGVWKYRIMIPCVQSGKTVSYTSRDITDRSSERYRACSPKDEIIPIKSTLYGIDYAFKHAVLVEGPFDVWRLGKGAVSSYGTKVTDAQFKLLKKFKKVSVIFDWEAEAEAEKVASKLAAFTDVEIIEIDAEDPDSMRQKDADLLMRDLGLRL